MLGPRRRGSPVSRLRGGEDLPGPPPHHHHHPAYLRPPRPDGLHAHTPSHGNQCGPAAQRVQYMRRKSQENKQNFHSDFPGVRFSTSCEDDQIRTTHAHTCFLSGILQPKAEVGRVSSCYLISGLLGLFSSLIGPFGQILPAHVLVFPLSLSFLLTVCNTHTETRSGPDSVNALLSPGTSVTSFFTFSLRSSLCCLLLLLQIRTDPLNINLPGCFFYYNAAKLLSERDDCYKFSWTPFLFFFSLLFTRQTFGTNGLYPKIQETGSEVRSKGHRNQMDWTEFVFVLFII